MTAASSLFPLPFLLLLSACGYIGEPLPPLLNIPMPASDLTAVQLGARIVARFTLPTLTTEGKVIREQPRLDLRIGPKVDPPSDVAKWSAGAQPVAGAIVEKGVAVYQVPISQWIGKQVQLAAKVIGAGGRDAGWSNVVALTVVPPPEQPAGLRAESAPQGVHLSWHGAGNLFAVSRRGPDDTDFAFAARSNTTEWTDNTAEFGKTYHYVVQSVVPAGDGETQSDPSQEAVITPADTFPPAVPAGLTAVPSTATIELVWERSADPNVAGYRIYRALGDGPLQRLADTQPLPTYSDHKVESGKSYRYAVTAVKTNGLESAMTAPVAATGP